MSDIDVNFFKPFVEGTVKTLEVQAKLKSTPGKPGFKGADGSGSPSLDIAGVIGITCSAFTGTITLGFPKAVFLKIMSNMLGEAFTEINADVADGAAELLNIIFGQAKRVLNEKGYDIQKAIPTVIRGSNLITQQITTAKVIILPFETEAGTFVIEIVTEPKK